MIDGPVLVGEALTAGLVLEAVFVEEGRSARADLAACIDRAEAAGADVWELPDGALARLTDVVHPPGVAAIARWTTARLPAPTPTSLVLVLVNVGDPGNAGTLVRTAEAAGATVVVFAGQTVDPTNPKCVRASAGALFHIPVVIEASPLDALDELGRDGYRRIATDAGASTAYDCVELRGPVAIVLGSEAHGLPADLAASIDETVTIPMAGRSESLNVAVAGSILCFEALRQRRTRVPPSNQVDER